MAIKIDNVMVADKNSTNSNSTNYLTRPIKVKETLITARNNSWVQQWLRYNAKPAQRKAAGVVWLEGEHLVVEALKRVDNQGFVFSQLVLPHNEIGRTVLEKLHQIFANTVWQTCEIIWLGEAGYKALCGMDSVPSVCGVLHLKADLNNLTLDYSIATVVLDGVQDPGNIGTVIRLCAAFGIPQVLLSTGCASAWSAKALRAGHGAQLAVNIHEDVVLNAVYTQFQTHRMPVTATSLSGNSVPLSLAKLTKNMVWVFGNEGQGISLASQTAATQMVHIPMQGGFESLNVGTAAAICLWAWQNK